MLILNYKRMKNDFLKFSSRKLFFSAMLVTALSAGASLPAFARLHNGLHTCSPGKGRHGERTGR